MSIVKPHPLTVAELIEQLKQLPQHWKVFVNSDTTIVDNEQPLGICSVVAASVYDEGEVEIVMSNEL